MNCSLPTRADWSIPEDVTYLNHGSFGPAPRVVQEAREAWSRRLERQPMDFYLKQMDPALDEAMTKVARLVGADPRDMAFVDNATVAMNVIAASINLEPDDEVLLTDHEYGAVQRIWRRKCEETGARIVTARIGNNPDESDRSQGSETPRSDFASQFEAVVRPISQAITDRTKLIVVSHITSPSAIILPVMEICREARSRGIAVCVDGPHAIAMLPVNLKEIDCDFYCASLHKWLSAPLGSGFLYVKREHQHSLRPHMTSWGRSLGGFPARWQDQLNWLGTRDPAPFLAVPTAIDFLDQVGFKKFRDCTHELARSARLKLEAYFGQPAWVADSPDWYGSMIAVPLPASGYKKPKPNSIHPLQRALREQFCIEIPVTECRGQSLMRVSCHLYNNLDDIDYLIESVKKIRSTSTSTD